MGFLRRRPTVDISALGPTVGDALSRMEADAQGRISTSDIAGMFAKHVAPVLPSDERIDLICVFTFRLGYDSRSGQRPEFAEGIAATGENGAYFAWADGPTATVVPYATVRDVEATTVALDIGDVPGLEVKADLDWLLIFAPPCSSPEAMKTLAMRLNGAVRPTWG